MQIFETYIDYIKNNPQKYWFRAKWYGWGWTPATWQGWVITIAYILLLVFLANTLATVATPAQIILKFALPASILTAAFIYIAYKKGEKPHWQWGPPKTK